MSRDKPPVPPMGGVILEKVPKQRPATTHETTLLGTKMDLHVYRTGPGEPNEFMFLIIDPIERHTYKIPFGDDVRLQWIAILEDAGNQEEVGGNGQPDAA